MFLNVMPPVLKTFLCWLLDDVAYDTVNKDHPIPPEKLRKCMALAALAIEWNVSFPSIVSVLMSTLSAPF
jgi:hypothetical protein